MSPDGSTRHLVYQLARRAILEPTDETRMRTRATTIEYLQGQACGRCTTSAPFSPPT